MNLDALLKKRDYYQANKDKIAKEVLEKYDTHFNIEFAHNSTAIEGNTLSLMETKLLLEDRLAYFEALEVYAIEGNLTPFAEIIAELADKQLDQYLAGIPANELQESPGMTFR